MKTNKIFASTILSLTIFASCLIPSLAQDSHKDKRTVSVSGKGLVKALPDMATVNFAIVTREKEAEATRKKNAETAKEILKAVKALGLPEKNMRLENLRLDERREYNKKSQKYERVGFEATRAFVVDVYNLDKLPALVAKVIQKGSSRLSNVEYGLKEKDIFRNEALAKAILDARERAAALLRPLGDELGQVLNIKEEFFDRNPPVFMSSKRFSLASAAEDAAPEPEAYAPGDYEIETSVQVMFEID